MRLRSVVRLSGGAIIVAIILCIYVFAKSNIQPLIQSLLETVRANGFPGVILLWMLWVLLSFLFFLPQFLVLSLAAGIIYGFYLGYLVSMIGSTLASAVTFSVWRLLRGRVSSSVPRWYPHAQALYRAVFQNPKTVVLLLRLSPVHPYAIFNFVLAVCPVTTADYNLWSWIGNIPRQMIFVGAGASLSSLNDAVQGNANFGSFHLLFGAGGVIVTVGTTAYITLKARDQLQKLMSLPGDESPVPVPLPEMSEDGYETLLQVTEILDGNNEDDEEQQRQIRDKFEH